MTTEQKLIIKKQELKVLKDKAERAKSELEKWERLAMDRSVGSQRQDAAFERHLKSAESNYNQAASDYEKQQELLTELEN